MARINQALLDALLTCPSISDKGRREAVIDDLPSNIKHNITRDPADKFDVRNIVKACQNHEDGLQDLIEIIENYEGDSLSLKKVKQLVADQPSPSIASHEKMELQDFSWDTSATTVSEKHFSAKTLLG